MKNQKSTSHLKKYCQRRFLCQREKIPGIRRLEYKTKYHTNSEKDKNKMPFSDLTTTGIKANFNDIPTVCKYIPRGMYLTIDAIIKLNAKFYLINA